MISALSRLPDHASFQRLEQLFAAERLGQIVACLIADGAVDGVGAMLTGHHDEGQMRQLGLGTDAFTQPMPIHGKHTQIG